MAVDEVSRAPTRDCAEDACSNGEVSRLRPSRGTRVAWPSLLLFLSLAQHAHASGGHHSTRGVESVALFTA